MANLLFSFPPSRTCLWDSTSTGSPCDLHLTRNSWLCVQISSGTLQLAVRHAKQSSRKLFDCFLIATVWITEGEGIALEVDRFDPGRPSSSGSGLCPTTLIPGDLPIPSQVILNPHPEAKYLTHNMETLRQSVTMVKRSLSSHTTPLDPALLLSLRVLCTCSENGQPSVECVGLFPGLKVEATPIKPISIVQTALARNLSGPLSLSVIQGKTKFGFITMEASRKLVLLLHSDPKAAELPLVGVWVSGVSSIYHPAVWMACVRYAHSTTLTDRVGGEGGRFVTLVYLEGSTKPLFTQCLMKDSDDSVGSVEMASGEHSLEASPTLPLLSFQLYPVQRSTALHTFLETVVESAVPMESRGVKLSCDLMPLPSPQPTSTNVPPKLTRDSELSMVSCLSLSDEGHALYSHTSPVTWKPHDLTPPAELQEDKENTPVSSRSQTGPRSSEITPTSPQTSRLGSESADSETQSDDSMVDKLAVKMTPRSADTRRLLRQQEKQLRALQEQVNTLLQAQSQLASPQSVNTTPKVEASTSTGESLYWPHPPPHPHSTHTTPSQLHCNLSVPSTPSQPHSFSTHSQDVSQVNREQERGSVSSSIVSGLTVQTVPSTLSQNISDLHLDLQSYVQSPSPCQSPSFGDSASLVEEDHSPAHPPTNQHQLYQDMISTVNALLNSQDEDSPDPTNQSESPPSSPDSHMLSRDSTLPQNSRTPDLSQSSERWPESQATSCHHKDQNVHNPNNSTTLSNTSQSSQRVTALPLNEVGNSTDFPLLHPSVLRQRFGSAEVSLLPVPRIVGPVTGVGTVVSYGGSSLDTAVYPLSSDGTLDENSRLADMIAMKYLGSKLPIDSSVQYVTRQPLLAQGTDSILDTDSAHMSMATRQYLKRHHLLSTNGSRAPENTLCKKEPPLPGPCDNILNIKRLKELPKLI